MIVLCLIVLIILTMLSWRLTSSNDNHISICSSFLVFWLAIVFFGGFHLYGLYEISDIVYILVTLGSVSFVGGYITLLIIHGRKKGKKIKRFHNFNITIKFKLLFFIVLSLAVFIIIKQILLLLPIILASGMADARGEMQLDEEMILGPGWDILIAYFAKPFLKATMIVLLTNSIREKFSIKDVLIVIFLLLLFFLSEGGRGALLDILFVLVYLFYAYRKRLSKKQMKIIRIARVLVAILPILATIERGSKVVQSIYLYYCGSLQYLSQALNNKELFDEYLWGMASYQGFIKPSFGLFQLFGIEKPIIIQEATNFIISAQVLLFDVAPKYSMNYYMTCFGYGYKDGGIFGMCIVLMIYGIICCYADIKERSNNGGLRWTAIKVAIFSRVLFCMASFPFASHVNAMTIIYILVISSPLFIKKIENEIG